MLCDSWIEKKVSSNKFFLVSRCSLSYKNNKQHQVTSDKLASDRVVGDDIKRKRTQTKSCKMNRVLAWQREG